MLAPGIRRALWDMRWSDLRPIQREAITAWFDRGGDRAGDPAGAAEASSSDLLIMAQTAGGKTEAAFLPVLSHIAHEPEGSVRAIYVGPLRALINDQFGRVELLCRHMHMPVHRWHGDVGQGAKRALGAEPGGVLLITPESLESLLVNRTARLSALFGGLRAVVIDELHAFLQGPRGLHLASLLARLRLHVSGGVRPRRVGLSATIGDPAAAAAYLNPDAPEHVRIITGPVEPKEVRIRVHWHSAEPGPNPGRGDCAAAHPGPEAPDGSVASIAHELVSHMHGSTNLVFANAKGRIEVLADAANALCRERGIEERFHVHHGSLSRAIREDVERAMKDAPPDTAICSSTLEMGIDIGSVRTVGQVGPPWSVASLVQRLGRSGRRDGEPRRLRLYIADDADPRSQDPTRRLPLDLVQTVAVLELMLYDRWIEPMRPASLDLSTLVQQIVALIAETGGLRPDDAHRRLCVDGPFRAVSPGLLARILRGLGRRDIVEQAPGGEIILGLAGERLRASREFYAAFDAPRQFTVRAGDTALGSLPLSMPPAEGDHLVLAGRRWVVRRVDTDRLEVLVEPARGAGAPTFSGSVGEVHARVRERMREVLADPPAATYLDDRAAARLRDAAAVARDEGLAARSLAQSALSECIVLAWSGTRIQQTIAAAVRSRGIAAHAREVSITCGGPADTVRGALAEWAAQAESGFAVALAPFVRPRAVAKHDALLDDDVLDESIAADRLDVAGALAVVREVLGEGVRAAGAGRGD